MADEKELQNTLEPTGEDNTEVVHGVGSRVIGAAMPKAKRIRPLAGIVLIVLVALAGFYMQHAMKARQQKRTAEAQAPKAGQGPAAQMERAMLDDQAKHGIDTGQSHLSPNLAPRSSLTGATGVPGHPASAVPPLEYAESGSGAGQFSPEEQRRMHAYQLEQEALEAATAVGSRGGTQAGPQFQNASTSASLDDAMAQARAEQADLRAQIARAASAPDAGGGTNLLGALRTALGTNPPSTLPVNMQMSDYDRQNGQLDKQQFLDKTASEPAPNYLLHARTHALSKYEVKSGWLIPAVLEQELNSDLPGMIRALVRENVYDTVTGKYLLIPAGSRIIGVYNSNIGYGQGAVQAVWRRILFPDGSSLDLGGFEGEDTQGASGFRDQVDNHWKRVIAGALLTSVFAAGLQISQGQNNSVLATQSYGQQISSAVGTQVGELGEQITRRNLNIQPTIKIRPGYRFFVRVQKDIVFQSPYAPAPASE
jgi:type IV secretion system protein TrbI